MLQTKKSMGTKQYYLEVGGWVDPVIDSKHPLNVSPMHAWHMVMTVCLCYVFTLKTVDTVE